MYSKLFNSTEISAVLDGLPSSIRSDVWFKNFYKPTFNPWMLYGFMRF